MSLDQKNIAITGSSGFMAAQLLPKLKQEGANIYGLDSRPSDMVAKVVDITDYNTMPTNEELKGISIDYVIHLAAIAAPNLCAEKPKLAYDVNVLGTNNVLRWAVFNSVKKVIFLSSAHTYGISPKFIPTPEDAPLQLNDTYTTTKILGERLCELYYSNYGLPYLAYRLYNSYGPNQTPDYFIPKKIAEAKTGKIVLTGAEVTKDFIYIDDTVDAIIRGITSHFAGYLNIGSGKQRSLESVAQLIAKEYGATYERSPQQPAPTYMQSDNTRIRAILDWTPKVSFEDGMKKTLDWYNRS